MSQTRATGPQSKFLAALATGQAAGLIMAVVVMAVFTLFLGKGPLYPVQLIGSVATGERALQGFHLPSLLLGLLFHQAGPSLLWGAAFGLAASRLPALDAGRSLALGLALGAVSMLGPYALIPALFKATQGVDLWNREVPLAWDWAAHLVFGACFVLYPAIRDRLAR